MRTRPLWIAVCLAGAIVAGVAAPADADRGVIDPCTVLTQSEVEDAVGAPVSPAVRRDPIRPRPGLTLCAWPTATTFGEIVLAVQHPGRKEYLRQRRVAKHRQNFQSIDIGGSTAFQSIGSVQMLRGQTLVGVKPQANTTAFAPIALRLAEQLAERVD